jgi:low affinity Fe/Cu permease
VQDTFHVIARKCSEILGSPWAFAVAVLIIVGWAVTGPIFGFSDTWQLIINTGTTIVTFLMVFLIQNTQNHDAKVMHLKLDELIRALTGARNNLVDLEELSEAQLKKLEEEFRELSERASHVHQAKAKKESAK